MPAFLLAAPRHGESTMISVLVFTLNEQQDLPGCLNSLSWSDDVHVFDSMSTDSTVNIARQYGANVVQRPFGDEAAHKNWALMNIPFKHEWVYCADADERVTPELAAAMKRAVFNAGDFAAFRVQRRDYLMGRWLKHVVPSPFNTRLFQPSKVRFERLINPVTVVDGPTGEISEHFDHFPFSKGMAHWVNKHNRY